MLEDEDDDCGHVITLKDFCLKPKIPKSILIPEPRLRGALDWQRTVVTSTTHVKISKSRHKEMEYGGQVDGDAHLLASDAECLTGVDGVDINRK